MKPICSLKYKFPGSKGPIVIYIGSGLRNKLHNRTRVGHYRVSLVAV